MRQPLNIIVAMTRRRVIGLDNRIPWHIRDDMGLFKKTTEGNTVLMGENTYKSLGKPLRNRNNIVVSPTLPDSEGIVVARDLESALDLADSYGKPIFSCGGARIYQQTIPLAQRLYISYVKRDYEGDAFFPEFEPGDYMIEEYRDYPDFEFLLYRKD